MKGSRLHLDLFRIFQDLTATKSFSKTAEINHITQSAVSQQLSFLERHVGAKLIERGKDRFFLTEAGREFLRCCWRVLRAVEETERAIRHPGAVSGPLRVETIYSIGLHALAPYVKSFLKQFPQVNLRVSYVRSGQIYSDLIEGDCDVGVLAYPQENSSLKSIPFQKERLALVCAPGDPLARKREAALKDLKGRPYIAFESGLPTRAALDELLLRRLGAFLPVFQEFDNVETLKRAVEVGLGVAILPENTVSAEVRSGSLACVPFASPSYFRSTAVLVRQDRPLPRAAQEFVRWLSK